MKEWLEAVLRFIAYLNAGLGPLARIGEYIPAVHLLGDGFPIPAPRWMAAMSGTCLAPIYMRDEPEDLWLPGIYPLRNIRARSKLEVADHDGAWWKYGVISRISSSPYDEAERLKNRMLRGGGMLDFA